MGNFSAIGRTPDGGRCIVVVVSDVFVIGCSSFSGLFVCHLIPHYHEVAWTPCEGYLVPFLMEGSKEVQDVTLVSDLKGYCRMEDCDTEQE